MMGKMVMVKFIPFGLFIIGFNPAAKIWQQTWGYFPELVAIFMILVIFIPEQLFLVVPSFRRWIKGDIENGKGHLIKGDLKDFFSWYIPALLGRIIVVLTLLELAWNKEVSPHAYYILGGLAGLTALPKLSKVFKND